MDSVTAAEIAKLETMTVSKLVEKFESLVGEKCRSRNKRYIVRRIAWRLQANAEGGLVVQQHPQSTRAKRPHLGQRPRSRLRWRWSRHRESDTDHQLHAR